MNNFKLTTSTLASIVLIVAFFLFPLIQIGIGGFGLGSMTGWEAWRLTLKAGGMGGGMDMITRLIGILIILIPISGGVIIWQKMKPEERFANLVKWCHLLPIILCVALVVGLFIQLGSGPDIPETAGMGEMPEFMREIERKANAMKPGVFDMLDLGFYVIMSCSIVLLFLRRGKIQDKELFSSNPAQTASQNQNS